MFISIQTELLNSSRKIIVEWRSHEKQIFYVNWLKPLTNLIFKPFFNSHTKFEQNVDKNVIPDKENSKYF